MKKRLFTAAWLSCALFPVIMLCLRFYGGISIGGRETARLFASASLQAALSTAACFVVAIVPAYYLGAENRLAKALHLTWIIPFFYPVISAIISFSIIYGIFPSFPRYSLLSVIIAHVFFNSPVLVRFLAESFSALPRTMREEAIVSGAGAFARFIHLQLPLSLKGAARGLFLTFVFCFTSFGVVLSFGSLKNTTPEVAIFSAMSTNLNFGSALSIALVQFFFIGALNALVTILPSYECENEIPVRAKRPLWSAVISLVWLLFEGMIVAAPVVWSVRYALQRKGAAFANLLSPLFNRQFPVMLSLINSTLLSFFCAALISIFAWFILSKKRLQDEFAVNSLFGLSSAVLAMSLLYVSIRFRIHPFFSIAWGYLVMSLPYAFSFLQNQAARFDSSLREQSALDGANAINRFLYIEWPLLSRAFRSVFMQLFAIFFGEFTIAYIFQAAQRLPLASVTAYQLASRRMITESYLFTSLITIIVACACAVFSTLASESKSSEQ